MLVKFILHSFTITLCQIKLAENESIHKIFNQTEIKKVFGVDNLDAYINIVSL